MSKNITRADRPHMFLKELDLYISYFSDKLAGSANNFSKKQEKYFKKFLNNLNQGIDYYSALFENIKFTFMQNKDVILVVLDNHRNILNKITAELDRLITAKTS